MGYIYKITNNINGKIYIGKTIHSIKHRFKEHRGDSKRYDLPLYRAFKKYGIENFSISVIEECSNDLLSEREKYWIEKEHSFDNGYNATRGGDGGRALYSEKDKENIRNLWLAGNSIKDIKILLNINYKVVSDCVHDLPEFKEKTQDLITKRIRDVRGKQIIQFDLNGRMICEYETITDAAKALGKNNTSSINSVCKHKQETAYGFIWRYKGDTPPNPNIHYGRKKSVCQYTIDGELVSKYESLSQAEKETGINCSLISATCRREQKTAGGFIWRYLEITGEDY